MATGKSVRLKFLVSLAIFAASLPFTLLRATEYVGHVSLALVWLTSLSMVDKRQFFARFYYMLFGVFFVLPQAISNDIEFLSVGQFFQNINLTPVDVVKMQVAIFIFLATFAGVILLTKNKQPTLAGPTVTKINNISSFYPILLISFAIIISFNVAEALAVYSQGYQLYFSGGLGVQKSIPVLMVEYTFIVLAIFGITSRKFLPTVLLAIYAASLVLSGQRMPGAMLVILIAATAYPSGLLRRRFFLICALGFGVAPPLFMIVQTLRAVGFDGLETVDLLYFFTDFWAVIGHSLDTLKAAIISDQTTVESVNLFARLNLTLNVVFSRVLGIDLGLSTNGFGVAFSQYFAPDLFFDRSVTFASSGIAESYYSLGMLGVVLYGAAAAWISFFFQRKMDRLHPFGLLILFVFGPRFLVGVRNELFGWVFEGVIYFLSMYPVYLLLKIIFLKRTALESSQDHSVITNKTAEGLAESK
ncbi:MAG: hypothetical protein QGI70_06500 [Paracoccaceae bacterium]|nr:hypothetical protein [Paracoccaceae bacterium]